MMKKLICLMLSVLMMLSILTSCSNDEDAVGAITDEASRYTTTLNMWVVKEEGMDEEQAKAVNAAINKITKAKFKTQLNIIYLSEAEYYEKVEKAFTDHEAALAEAKKNGTYLKQEILQDETVLNEYGIPELKYPEAFDFQVDILWMGSFEKYREYTDKGWLIELDGKLENSAVELASCISESFMEAMLYYGVTCAVPNNSAAGEYTYLAVNTDISEVYGYTAESLGNSVFNNTYYDFLNLVYESGSGVYPLYSENGEIDIDLLHYWNFDVDSVAGDCLLDPSTFSLFGGFYNDTAKRGSSIAFSNLLTTTRYEQRLQNKVYYENTANFITTDPEAESAVRVVKGNWEDRAALEEMGYTVIAMESPHITSDELYSSMYGIGSHSADEDRSMEIITYLNTNKEFRNLLQYGIEGVNYTLETYEDENGKEYVYAKETEDNKYKMDVYKTGNAFIAYPDSVENIMKWEYGKMQNLDAKAYPTLGLFLNLADYKIDEKSIRVMNAVSAKFKTNVLDTFTTVEEVVRLIEGRDSAGAVVEEAYANKFATNHAGMAAFLLNKIGEDVTYTMNGTTHTVTVEDLTAALACMNKKDLADGKNALQSPNALYQDWRESSGVNDN